MKKIIFATANLHKLSEVQAVLGPGVELVTPASMGITEDIPEDGDTLESNALQKAHYIYDRTGLGCFADDTGLEVEALDGAPGVYSARYAERAGRGVGHCAADNMALLLDNLKGQPNRAARFRTVIALLLPPLVAGDAPRQHLFEGEVSGVITQSHSGAEGFGYDPIFRPDGYDVTFAEMEAEQKNSISHRGRATAKLAEFFGM